MTPISIKGLEKSECVRKQENGAINPGNGRIRNSREKSPDGLGPGTTTLKPGCRACKRAMEKADAATSRHLQAQKAQPVRPCGRWNAQNQGGGEGKLRNGLTNLCKTEREMGKEWEKSKRSPIPERMNPRKAQTCECSAARTIRSCKAECGYWSAPPQRNEKV